MKKSQVFTQKSYFCQQKIQYQLTMSKRCLVAAKMAELIESRPGVDFQYEWKEYEEDNVNALEITEYGLKQLRKTKHWIELEKEFIKYDGEISIVSSEYKVSLDGLIEGLIILKEYISNPIIDCQDTGLKVWAENGSLESEVFPKEADNKLCSFGWEFEENGCWCFNP